MTQPDFDLSQFLPYLLAQAAEASSQGFQRFYKDRYGMLRTEWRVLFHLGRYGPQTARQICARSSLHKTKVSRAVSALEGRRFLTRTTVASDRRQERLELTRAGQSAYRDITEAARRYDADLEAQFTPAERAALRAALMRLAP